MDGRRDRATIRGDEADHAVAIAQDDEDLALAEILQIHLANLDTALQRCAEGSYGICVRCLRAIPDERLSIFPAATLCVPCKATTERF